MKRVLKYLFPLMLIVGFVMTMTMSQGVLAMTLREGAEAAEVRVPGHQGRRLRFLRFLCRQPPKLHRFLQGIRHLV